MLHGYCWPQSGKAGETIDVMVSADTGTCSIELVRIGADEVVVARYENLPVSEQPVPTDVGANGCGWSPNLQIEIDPEWTSGYYLVRLSSPGSSSPDSSGEASEMTEAFFVVKPTEPGDVILVLSTSTWAAYNHWGAPSFYTGGHVSSLQRPLPKGFLDKQQPERYRAAAFVDMARDERHQHFAEHSWFSSAAGYANWERLFVAWAEQQGLSLDFATSIDLATNPDLLDPYQLYFSIGHDEYWSASMRDHVEGWVERGGVALFLSGNTAFWQIRLEDDAQRVVGYKFGYLDDPVVGTDAEHTVATMWSDPLCRRPENEMTGVSFTRGGYANMIHSPPGGGYTVHRPDHWVFAGLDLAAADVVGAESKVVGFECDGCAFEMVDDRPVATGEDGTPSNFEILGTAPAKLWETHEVSGGLDDTYVGELNWVAARVGGEDNVENRERFEAGHAVMGVYERGDGWVFTSGCTDWAYGLADPQISQITRNLVERAGVNFFSA